MVSAGAFCGGFIGGGTHGADDHCASEVGKLYGADADGSGSALNENGVSSDRAGDMDGAMRGNAGNAEACALLHRNGIGKRRCFLNRDDGELCGGSERAIGLGAEAPDTATEPFRRSSGTNTVDDACAVAVRNDARVRHADAERVLALLHVSGIDARGGNANADLAWARFRIGHFSNGQDITRRPLLLIPCGSHANDLTWFRVDASVSSYS